jgi:hypothetical protein
MILMNDNGGWCWYQDDKIIYDPVVGDILISTAADDTGFGGVGGVRINDVDVTAFNIDTGKRTRNLQADRGQDDHNMGAFWIRPDGRYLHVYGRHNSDDLTYFRTSTNPHDASSWAAELNYDWSVISGISGGTLTYTNLHYMSAEGTGSGRLYNIVRWNGSRPNISYSDNLGVTWQYGGLLSEQVGPSGYSYYYHKFRGNGVDRIDFICTEQHPRNYNNNVYHGYIKGGKSYDSYDNVIDNNIFDQTAPGTDQFTRIFAADPCQLLWHTGWTNELEYDKDSYPVCLYQTRYGQIPWGDGSGQNNIGAADHRFFYARFNGSTWTSTELCKLGVGLHLPEQDYTGMGCIHPDDANIVYVATQFDPRDDTEYQYREIFKGVTPDKGLTWDWTQITFDSTQNNTRPAIPPWDANNTAVVWTRGNWQQTSYENYDLTVMGIIEEEGVTNGLISYTDASTSNTKNADDSAFSPTGPSGSTGAADGLWHQYTGYGNGGSCYTAGDGGTENVPTIKTKVTGLSDGIYNVFAYFWCDPNLDWGIRGGLTSAESDMMCFSKQSAQFADANQFSSPITTTVPGYQLYQVYIGRTIANGGTPITVYLDNYDSTYNSHAPTRTTYDGIGVSAVTYPGAPDSTPPTPNPMTWSTVPTATSPTTITMTATTATDTQNTPVQYYFECTTDADKSSSWQTSTTYVATNLTPSTSYSFRVKACDYYNTPNATGWSSTLSETTPDSPPVTGTVTTNTSSSARSSATFSHEVAAGDDRLLIVSVMVRGSITANSVTYGGTALTKAISRAAGGNGNCTTEIWYLIAPPVGTANVVVTFSGSADPSAIAAVNVTGADQSSPIGATNSNVATIGTNITMSITTLNDTSLILGAATNYGGDTDPFTPGADITELWDNATGTSTSSDNGQWGGYKNAMTAGAYTFNTTSSSSDDWTIAAVEIKKSAAVDLPPAAPTGLTATAGNNTVSLNWNDNSEADLDGYNVYRSLTSGSGYGKLNVALVSTSDYIDNTAVNGTPYYYVVTAVDVNGHESSSSNEATATPWYQTCAELQAGGDGLASDLTGDCYVDYWDLEVIANYWLSACTEPSNCEGADFEPTDGIVDLLDYSDFAIQWLECNDPEDPSCSSI